MSIIIKALDDIGEEILDISERIMKINIKLSEEEKEKILESHKELATNFGLLETILNRLYKFE